MASKQQKASIVGPGFNGWNVLELLVQEKYKVTVFVRIYIHTSGTSLLDDHAQVACKSDKIYYDHVRSDIDSLSDDAPHRKIDLAIIEKQKRLGERAKMAIMIPPLIYGYNHDHTRLTIQIPTLTRFALKRGHAGYVGDGLAVASNVHVKDLARAYGILLHHVEHESAIELLENPYYLCEATGNEEPSWISPELYGDIFGKYTGVAIGLNSWTRAVRLRELGWKPLEKSWKASYIEDELPEILKEDGHHAFKGYSGAVAS